MLLVALVGCGGGSSGKLADLTDEEAGDLCDYVAEQLGDMTSKDCGDGTRVIALSRAACIAGFRNFPATCDATVADAEACADAAGEDLCRLRTDPSCDFGPQCRGN
jgi:hypothetical protein